MYFLVFGGCNRITPFIVSVQDTKEKILEKMNGKIIESFDDEPCDFSDYEKLLWKGTVIDIDFFKNCYSDIGQSNPCICMPIVAFILYNKEGDAVSVMNYVADVLSY